MGTSLQAETPTPVHQQGRILRISSLNILLSISLFFAKSSEILLSPKNHVRFFQAVSHSTASGLFDLISTLGCVPRVQQLCLACLCTPRFSALARADGEHPRSVP